MQIRQDNRCQFLFYNSNISSCNDKLVFSFNNTNQYTLKNVPEQLMNRSSTAQFSLMFQIKSNLLILRIISVCYKIRRELVRWFSYTTLNVLSGISEKE